MFGIKTLRIRKLERRREAEEEQRREEQKKEALRKEQEEYKKELEKLEKRAPEYVLTISAPVYIERAGKKLTDYDFKSVSSQDGYDKKWRSIWESALQRIVREGEKIGAEVIVDVRPSHYDEEYLYLIGTALIPKEK